MLLPGIDAFVAGLEANRFPRAMLRDTPFSTCVVPGIVLACLVGGSAALATWQLWRDPAVGGRASVIAGFITMGWISGEALLLRQVSWIEGVYFALGLVMFALGLDRARR